MGGLHANIDMPNAFCMGTMPMRIYKYISEIHRGSGRDRAYEMFGFNRLKTQIGCPPSAGVLPIRAHGNT
jgi:hypothetical protein